MIHQIVRGARGEFDSRNGIITGACVLCSIKLSLSWFEWCRHLLHHTDEQRHYCTECNIGFDEPHDHRCATEHIIDIYRPYDIGACLDGFVCKLCNYLQINDYRLLEHIQAEHPDALYENDVERIILVPDVRPQEHIIHTGYAYIERHHRFRCGVGNCLFHGKNSTAFCEHFAMAHKIVKTFFCPHCKKIINRMRRTSVPLEEILLHIDLHASHVYQCFYCQIESVTSKDAIQTHLTAEHAELPIKYWHNQRKVNNEIEKCELIEILLECRVCGERVDSSASAIDHFRLEHSGRQFNFLAVKFIKDTSNELHVICSVDDSAGYREVFGCGLCTDFFSNKVKWLEHFNEAHPNHLLAGKHDLKFMMSMNDDATPDPMEYQRLMLFSCASCTHSTTPYMATIDGCFEHWRLTHIGSDFKPFGFHLIELMACNYCNTVTTFHDLKTHINEKHREKRFVALKAFVFRKICALCNFASDATAPAANDDFIEHFCNKRDLAMQTNVLNPMPIHDLDLARIRQIFVHKKVQCVHCHRIFQTKMNYREHHANDHPKVERMYCLIDDTEMVQLIAACCRKQIDSKLFFNHLTHHRHTLACNKCLYETSDAFVFVCHQVECHERTSTTIAKKYRQFLEHRYWRSEVIFGNGLVVNRFNTHGTKFDCTEEFEQFIERTIDDKLQKWKTDRSDPVSDADTATEIIDLDD